MKTKNVTFCLPIEVVNLLHSKIEKRELNKFATIALKKALEQEDELRKAYAQANEDPGRIEVSKDWSFLDSDGWDE